jgi:predicted nucleic acid-binding protein
MTRWQAEGQGLCAPSLWLYELTSALAKASRFEALTGEEAHQALEQAYALGVRLFPPDATQARAALVWTLRLKRAAAYDSFYLALAESLGCDLWTADRHLANAAGVPWVHAIG